MKKTCNRCRANADIKCSLGHKIMVFTGDWGDLIQKPAEECPKPLTKVQLELELDTIEKKSIVSIHGSL